MGYQMETKNMKLLLIEDDANECSKFKEVANRLEGIEFVSMTNSATKGLQDVKRFIPEGIILDLELNSGEGSGFEFLNELRNLNLSVNPKIVVTTNVYSDSVYDYLHENKVDFIFYKKQENYSPERVLNTLLLLKGYNSKTTSYIVSDTDEDTINLISDKINAELDLIGVGTHLQGRKYLHDAIMFILTEGKNESKLSIIQFLTSKYKKANSTISRAMQNAILYAWRISSIEDLSKYYTAKINYETGVPTPNEFIYYYVNKIKKSL